MPGKGQSSHRVMPTINISLNGVVSHVKRLNPRKACGPDKMPILVLNETSNKIAIYFSKIAKHWRNTNGLEKCQHRTYLQER